MPSLPTPLWRSPRVIVIAVAILLLTGGLVWWWQLLSAPVVRPGMPTGSVSRPPAATPTPTPSSPSATPAGSPTSASAKPSAPSSKPAKAGTFTDATLSIASTSGTGSNRKYAVRTEDATGLKANTAARVIADVLNDPRSWAGAGDTRFTLIKDPTQADFMVTIATGATAAKACSPVAGTCKGGDGVMIDAAGWSTPPAAWDGDTDGFRRYLVNHGIGQQLGKKAASCDSGTASVMVDQTSDLGGCRTNPWPHP